MKCAYKHCRHGGEVDKDFAVKVGNRYYHQDCLKEKEDIKIFLDLYVKLVDPSPVFSQVRKIVNDIVYKNGCSIQFLIFSLRYFINSGEKLRSPFGLYYIVKNKNIIDAWREREFDFKRRATAEINKKIDGSRAAGTTFTHKEIKKKTLEDIMGG